MIRTYSELIQIPTYEERLKYLQLNGTVGKDTFGFDRIFNQKFYRSKEWHKIRDKIIFRDNGNDLASDGFPVAGKLIIHHMNPIDVNDIVELTDYLINPEFLITTSLQTHNAIHYGNTPINKSPITRTKNDTCPWRQ